VAGDHRLDYADLAAMHLSGDHSLLRCAPAEVMDPAWRRFLLDTGLATAALVRGFEALHAGAFMGANGIVAVAAGTGGGKSSLLAELVRRGRTLICDDVLALSRRDAVVVGHAGPPLMNLPVSLPDGSSSSALGRVLAEINGENWIALDTPPAPPAAVAAVVTLDRAAGLPLELVPLEPSPIALIPHALIGGRTNARARARFDLLADLTTQVRLLRLTAPDTGTTAATADLLDAI
jgi:hypothetical protein